MNYVNPEVTLFKNLFNAKDTPFNMEVKEVINRIRNGYPELFAKLNIIQNENAPKEEREKAKKTLKAIMFNGTFSERNDNGLIKHSTLMITDFDKYPNEETLLEEKKRLSECEYVYAVFRSPSGKGLKALVHIPPSDKHEHKRRFNAFKEYFKSDYFDDANKNISRVCFESYDPEVYLNFAPELFEGIEQEKGFSVLEKEPICILNDEQKKIDLIMGFNWKKDFVEGERNLFLFDIASAFCEYGISQQTAENYILNNVVIGDFKESEAITAIKSAYKKRTFDCKYFEDYDTANKIKFKLKNGSNIENITKELNVTETVVTEIEQAIKGDFDIFWELRVDKRGNETITIEPNKYSKFLEKNGFNKYYPENVDNPFFVRVKENKVRLSSSTKIKDFILNYLQGANQMSVWNYCAKSPYLFNDSHLNMLDSINLKMLADTIDKSYVPFRNGIVEITREEKRIIPFIDVDGYIWEEQIIKRDFSINNDFKNDFQDFIHKVCNNDKLRIDSLETTLGYLLHTYKDKTHQKAIIFNDQEIDDNPNGGSGKSLVLSSINNIRRLVKIDGKAFDPKKSDFVYQRVNVDSQVLAFDDVKKNFDFEQLFSLITEGITVNRKNKDEIFIPFERSPKIVITTNYVINGTGSSHERRRHEIEFYQYFNKERSPLTEYGRLLFDSWTEGDWNKFDNYMLSCIQKYLKKGLVSAGVINANEKRLIQSTSKDFYDWVMEENLQDNKVYLSKDVIMQFQNEYPSYKDLTPKKMSMWVKCYAEMKGKKVTFERYTAGRGFEITDLNTTKTEKEDDSLPF